MHSQIKLSRKSTATCEQLQICHYRWLGDFISEGLIIYALMHAKLPTQFIPKYSRRNRRRAKLFYVLFQFRIFIANDVRRL